MKYNIYLKLCFSIIIYICVFFTSYINAYAKVQWADTILESSGNYYSKFKNKNCYSNKQILGQPSIMSDFGETVCAWTPREVGRNDFISIGYKEPMYVKQVSIHENYNPGAIVKVTLYGEGKDTLVYSNSKPRIISRRGRMFNIFLKNISFKVNKVRIDINTESYRDFYQIDAVAISDEVTPISSKINLSNDVLEIGDLENLGPNINSKFSELAPVIAPDGKTLYFTRENHPYNYGRQSIWFSKMDTNDNFQPAQNIGRPLNTRYHSFAISILPDGNSMLVGNVYNPNGTLSEGFSMTYKQQGDTSWSFPQKLVVEDYYNNARGSYCLASNGRILLLSVDRNEGYGGNDLYVSFLQGNGIWSKPKNLGCDLNTAEQENSPFLAADGVTLYFSSSGHPGYGSCDIFVTKRLDDTWQKWSKPINLGPKINTRGWDAYFTVTASGDYAYFVSSKKNNNEDIYRVKLPAELQPESVVLVAGKVINKKTNIPIEANIVYEKLSTGEIIGTARSNPKTGEYKIALPAKEKYSFRAESKGFIPINENLDLMNLKNYYEVKRDLFLVPIEQGQIVRINNIFFDTGEAELLPDSYPELKRLVNIMNENLTMKIKLLGHTDNVGNYQDNLKLSLKRAEAVKSYIVSLGITEDRITTKGYGYSKPIATNKTEEGRSQNRRVECSILEK